MKKIPLAFLVFCTLFSCKPTEKSEPFVYVMMDSTITEDYGTYLSHMRSIKEGGHIELEGEQVKNNYSRYKADSLRREYDYKWEMWNINQEGRRKMYDAGTPVKDIDRIMDSISKNQ